MRVGTKSVLFGAHCLFLHPWFVAAGWWKLYGWHIVRCRHTGVRTCIFDPRLWLCFIVHDLGYWGQPNMDGDEGEQHPVVGAAIVGCVVWRLINTYRIAIRWHNFTLYHSRFLARRDGVEPSLLCWADKMAIALTPSWLYLPMTMLTGELAEYMIIKTREIKGRGKTPKEWHRECREYCRRLALEHRDGRTWTPRSAS